MTITFTSYTTTTGDVLTNKTHRAVASAVADTVISKRIRSALATGYSVTTANVMCVTAPSARALAANDAVITHSKPSAAAAAFTVLPSAGIVTVDSPPSVAYAAGYSINSGNVSTHRPRRTLATAIQNVVVTRRVHSVESSFTPAPTNFGLLVMQQPLMVGTLGTLSSVLTSSMLLQQTLLEQQIIVVTDIMSMGDAYSVYANVLEKLSDTMSLGDIVAMVLKLQLASSAVFESSSLLSLRHLQILIDYMTFAADLNGTGQVVQLIAEILALRDAIGDAQLAKLLDTAAMSSTLAEHVIAYVKLIDQLTLLAVQANHIMLVAYLSDGFKLSDSTLSTSSILMMLRERVHFSMTLNDGEDTYTAWVMTPESKAMRSYSNFPFNSYCQMGDQYLGACSTGVYQFGGPTDDGAQIMASVRSGLLDFGTKKLKRIDKLYTGYTSTGTLCLRVCATTRFGEKVEYTYSMVPQTADAPREGSMGIGRGVRSVYWSFEINNAIDGSAFELYDVNVLPMVLTGRVI